MTVYNLNRDQLTELKQRYMTEEMNEHGETPSYEDLADADEVFSDDYIRSVYRDYVFSPDDFASSAGRDEEDIIDYDLEVSGQADKYELADDLRQIASAIEDGHYSGLANNGTTWSIS